MLPRRPSRKDVSHLPLVSRWQVRSKAPFLAANEKARKGKEAAELGKQWDEMTGENYRRRRRSRVRRLAALPGREAPLVERAHKNKEAQAGSRSQFHSPLAGRSRGADGTGGSMRTGRQQKLTARRFLKAPEEREVGGREDEDDDE